MFCLYYEPANRELALQCINGLFRSPETEGWDLQIKEADKQENHGTDGIAVSGRQCP